MNIRTFWRGHLFLFDQPQVSTYSSQGGARLLLIFLFMELIVRRLLGVGAQWFNIADRDWWQLIKTTILLGLACLLVTKFAKVRLPQLGLYSWQRWSRTEKFYFPQIMAIAIVIFSYFTFASLWIFAAIFSMGLFFATLFQRSGNLWIIGIMHGVGDWFMDGLPKVSRTPG